MTTRRLDNKRRLQFPAEFRPGMVFQMEVKGLSQVTFTRLKPEKVKEGSKDPAPDEAPVQE